MGYWGSNIGKPHTVPCKLTGSCGSVMVRLIPAPRGTGIVAGNTPKKILGYAGIQDVFTSSDGQTKTLGNFAKATFYAIAASYEYLTPDMWPQQRVPMTPFQEFTDVLSKHVLKH
eukprot:JZ549053.1.p1 GENE.JZ549053.1~~JZ549053.1.p1  ORF type:complete len:115 (+),score=51.58 JZ549053.1:382-726(+)